jgi:hypothetical protein
MRTAYLERVVAVWGLLFAAALVVIMTALAHPFEPEGVGPGQDARAYWAAPVHDPYVPGSVGDESAYLYSPAFLVTITPLRLLPWPIFLAIWTTLLLGTLLWMVRPTLFLPMILFTLPELWGGNITIFLAAAIVLSFRFAGAWAFPLLTKVTPGVGILWYGARGEWRDLGIAVATTALVIAGTALAAPGLWAEWTQLLTSSIGSSTVAGSVPIPLSLRLPLAVAVIVLAARTDRRWLLPIGVLLAMPVIWWGSLSILAASVALRRVDIEPRVVGTLSLVEGRVSQRVASASS